nr:immunoglobulin light chain junction region [Macaca mulatta]MOW06373.1 immunoglobulin light chain junction region [Macaca mulatta]
DYYCASWHSSGVYIF